MVQDNSLVDQARHSEQLSLQQLQLAELQKIANKLSSNSSVAGNPAQSIGAAGSTVGNSAMPTNMMSMPANHNNVANLAAVSGLAMKSGINGINNATTVGRSALDRTVGYIERMQNSPFFAYKSIDWTRTNMEQAEYIQMQSSHKLQNAGIKFASSLGNMGMASIGGAIGGAAAGPLGMIAGTIGGSALGSIGGDQIIKHVGVQQGYEKWLHQNGGRFINMFESNDALGDGFSGKENQSLAKTLSKMNTKFNMSDDEMFTMLNNVTDAGLMKSASDMESFTTKFGGLVETVKKGAKMLNASYEEITELYGEWNKMGIKTDSEQMKLTSQIKTLSSITGATEGVTADTLTALISNLTNGTTLDAAAASGVAQVDLGLSSLAREEGLWSDNSMRVVENLYGSDDSKVAAAMTSSIKSAYGTDELKSAALAAMKMDASGNVSVDQNTLTSLISSLNNGSLSVNELMNMGGNKLISGELGAEFGHKWTSMTQDQIYQMMLQGGGAANTNQFMTSMINGLAAQNPNIDANTLMVNMGIASNSDQAQMLNEWSSMYGQYGSALQTDIQSQNNANLIRNDASSEFGVPLTQRIKNGWENIWQGAASLIPAIGTVQDGMKDWWTDTDTAMRNGYSSADKTRITDGEYRNVFKDIANNSDKLDKEFKLNIKDGLSKTKSSSAFSQDFDTVLDIVTSPSRWNSLFNGNSDYVNTDLSHDGTSVKKLLKKINKSKTMDEDEKEAMIANINQATGQTQDLVSGALDVVTALGGKKARENMLDTITIDTATKVKTGAKGFDDFTNEKVLNKLSLEDQKKIQELAVDKAVKQIETQYKGAGGLDKLAEKIEKSGYAEGNEDIQKILAGGISKSEVKGLVKELMTVSQGGSGISEVEKTISAVTQDTADSTKSANKNLDKVNKNMTDMTDKLDELAETMNKAIKNLDKRTNQLETTMNKY